MDVIQRVPDIDSDNPEGQTLEKIKGEVEFKHVKFMYPSRPETPVFDDFCLRVQSGNGSGWWKRVRKINRVGPIAEVLRPGGRRDSS